MKGLCAYEELNAPTVMRSRRVRSQERETQKNGQSGERFKDSEETGFTKTAYNIVRNRAGKMTDPNAAGLQVLGKGGGGLGWSRSGPAKSAGTAAIARWPDL